MATAGTMHRAEGTDRVAHHLQHVTREDHVELASSSKTSRLVTRVRAEPLSRVLEARSRPALEGRWQVRRDHFGGSAALHLERPETVSGPDVEAMLLLEVWPRNRPRGPAKIPAAPSHRPAIPPRPHAIRRAANRCLNEVTRYFFSRFVCRFSFSVF